MKTLLAALALAAASMANPVAAADGGARETLTAFYTFHFSHDMGFDAKTLSARAQWLTPELRRLCGAYFSVPDSPDVVPPIDGDPFTDSQEYPTAWHIVKVSTREDSASATVRFTGPNPPRDVTVRLREVSGKWLIDDVVYGDGESFRKLLKTPR